MSKLLKKQARSRDIVLYALRKWVGLMGATRTAAEFRVETTNRNGEKVEVIADVQVRPL